MVDHTRIAAEIVARTCGRIDPGPGDYTPVGDFGDGSDTRCGECTRRFPIVLDILNRSRPNDAPDGQDLARFAREIFARSCDGFDVDGDFIQECGVACGVIVPTDVSEPCCDPEDEYASCACYQADPDCFPTTCYRLADNLCLEV